MTAKEPRPASHFRLVLQYSPAGMIPLTIELLPKLHDTTAFGVPPDAAAVQEHTDFLGQRLIELRATLPPVQQALLDLLMEQASAGGELDWPADGGATPAS